MATLSFEMNGQARMVPIGESPVTVGRGESATLQLDANALSREHFRIFYQMGRYYVEDLGSSNGTIMRGVRLQAPAPLTNGDVIGASGMNFTFVDDSAGTVTITVMNADGSSGQSRPVTNALSIGRADHNDLTLPVDMVSGSHCRIEKRGANYFLMDLGSSNGTWVGGDRVSNELMLWDGDIITLGQVVRLHFSYPGQPGGGTTGGVAQARPKRSSPIALRDAMAPTGPSWGGVMATALLALVLCASLGWFLPPSLFPTPAREGYTEEPAQSPLLSFDAEGNLSGWEVTAANHKVKAGRDERRMYDGVASLALVSEGASGKDVPATVVASRGALPALGGATNLSFWVRGKNNESLTYTAFALVEGVRMPIGRQRGSNLNSASWAQVRVPLSPVDASLNPRLELRIDGVYSAMWIDRIELSGSSSVTGPSEDHKLINGIDVVRLAESGVSLRAASANLEVKLVPMQRSDTDVLKMQMPTYEWSSKASTTGFAWSALNFGRPTTSLDPSTAKEGDNQGVQLTCRNDGKDMPLALVMRVPVAGSRQVIFYDKEGVALTLVRQPEKGISDVAFVVAGGFTMRFTPKVTLRVLSYGSGSATLAAYDRNMNSRELTMFAFAGDVVRPTLIQRVYDSMNVCVDLGQFSAAMERARFLASVREAAFADIRTEAQTLLTDMQTRVDDLYAAIENDTNQLNTAAANEDVLRSLGNNCSSFMTKFPGDPRVDAVTATFQKVRTILGAMGGTTGERFLAELRALRPPAPTQPDVLAKADEQARAHYGLAQRAYASGDWALAHLLADNVAWNLHYTSVSTDADGLARRIESSWNNSTERRKWLLPRIEEAESRALLGSYDEAIELLRLALMRYPLAPEAAALRARMRVLEAEAQSAR